MKLYFRIKLKNSNKDIEIIDYELLEIEVEKLINEVGKDFLSIPISNNSDFIRLELDVVFEDVEMIYKIISLIADMFPNSLKFFQNMAGNKRKKRENLIKAFITDNLTTLIKYDNTTILELDKFFMLYYIIIAKRDLTNINRNIVNKLNKIGINTINFVPFVGKLELTDAQFSIIKRKTINTDESTEEKPNLLILDSNSLNVQKLTENYTPYYIYLYRQGAVSVKSCTHEYYCISITPTLEKKGFNLLVDFSEEQENIKLIDIYTRCKLFNDLCNSTKILSYKEILGILTNMYNTNIITSNSSLSSIKYILNHIDKQNKEFWKLLSIFIKGTNCQPKKCREYCAYANTCIHAETMLRTVHIKKDTIERIDRNEKYVTVEESREELKEVMVSAYNSLENCTTDLELIIAPPRCRKNRGNN